MRIYTRSGDQGETSLYDHTRVAKDSMRVESYGTIDELNSSLGLARSLIKEEKIREIILKIQKELFEVAGELATKEWEQFPAPIKQEQVEELERIIDEFTEEISQKEQAKFIIPGSNQASAALHLSRTICRRAERRIITLARQEKVSPVLIKYINRLSDLIYILARFLESRLCYVDFNKEES